MLRRLSKAPARALFATVFLVAIAGCSSATVSESEASGTYRADADWGHSTLVLMKDHSFTQTVHLNSGAELHLAGQWKIDKHTAGEATYTTINFTPYYKVTHDKQGVYTLASAFSIYHVPFGGIKIAADPDYGIAHRKLSRN